MSDGEDAALRTGVSLVRLEFFPRRKFNMRPQSARLIKAVLTAHAIILADAAEIFPREGVDFGPVIFPRRSTWSDFSTPRAGAARPARYASAPPRPAEARDPDHRQRLKKATRPRASK